MRLVRFKEFASSRAQILHLKGSSIAVHTHKHTMAYMCDDLDVDLHDVWALAGEMLFTEPPLPVLDIEISSPEHTRPEFFDDQGPLRVILPTDPLNASPLPNDPPDKDFLDFLLTENIPEREHVSRNIILQVSNEMPILKEKTLPSSIVTMCVKTSPQQCAFNKINQMLHEHSIKHKTPYMTMFERTRGGKSLMVVVIVVVFSNMYIFLTCWGKMANMFPLSMTIIW